jgi:hypothetical protein
VRRIGGIMEISDVLEQCKLQDMIDKVSELIPEIDSLVIGYTKKDGLTEWISCCEDIKDTLWIAECIRHSVMSDSLKEITDD